jgi:hypothetical protein
VETFGLHAGTGRLASLIRDNYPRGRFSLKDTPRTSYGMHAEECDRLMEKTRKIA